MPQFADWTTTAASQIKRNKEFFNKDNNMDKPRRVSIMQDAKNEDDDIATNLMVNELLFQRLLTIFSAVLDAACLSNNWIVIDRTNIRGSSPTGEYLLELAIAQTTQRPVVIVIDSLNRFRQHNNDDAKNVVLFLTEMMTQCKPMSEYNSHEFEPLKMEALYTLDEWEKWQNWKDVPLPVEPHPYDLGSDGTLSDDSYWLYHYQSALFTSGTHYIILDGDENNFPLTALGAMGTVAANGGTRTFHRLKNVIQQGKPLIMMQNTGGCCQAYASLHRSITQMQITGDFLTTNEILDQIELVNSEQPWSLQFGVQEIMLFRELSQRAPLLFHKTVVTVDLLKDSAEEVLSTVTGCFASTTSGVPELGIGSAETAVVYNAWKRHLVLYENCRALQSLGNWLFIFVLVLVSQRSFMMFVPQHFTHSRSRSRYRQLKHQTNFAQF